MSPPDSCLKVQSAAAAAPAYQAARQQAAVTEAQAGVQEAQRVLMLVQSEVRPGHTGQIPLLLFLWGRGGMKKQRQSLMCCM